MGKAGKGTGSFGAHAYELITNVVLSQRTHSDAAHFLLQVRGATRPTHFAEGAGGGPSTFRSLHARHVVTQQPALGNVRDPCVAASLNS